MIRAVGSRNKNKLNESERKYEITKLTKHLKSKARKRRIYLKRIEKGNSLKGVKKHIGKKAMNSKKEAKKRV
jgi:hypothetical protein